MPALKTNILIVEDDVQLRTLLTAILNRSGYNVRTAEDGFSALAEIRLEMPDIVLSDLYMLGMSGFELLSVIRRRFPAINVIAMSSAFSGGDIPTGVAADAFYQKATSIPTLLQLLSEKDEPRPSHRANQAAPIWIATHPSDPSEPVTISCPECLRTSAYAPTPAARSVTIIRSTACSYCSTLIQYAMVQSVDPGLPGVILRRAALPQALQFFATGTDG
jgi:CheY-like chemotaxis protein